MNTFEVVHATRIFGISLIRQTGCLCIRRPMSQSKRTPFSTQRRYICIRCLEHTQTLTYTYAYFCIPEVGGPIRLASTSLSQMTNLYSHFHLLIHIEDRLCGWHTYLPQNQLVWYSRFPYAINFHRFIRTLRWNVSIRPLRWEHMVVLSSKVHCKCNHKLYPIGISSHAHHLFQFLAVLEHISGMECSVEFPPGASHGPQSCTADSRPKCWTIFPTAYSMYASEPPNALA